MKWKLELVAIPVSDVERAKRSTPNGPGFTPTMTTRSAPICASSSSPHPARPTPSSWGPESRPSEPGSAQAQLVVADIETARKVLVDRSVGVTEIQDLDRGSFAFFDDPDGNHWDVQQVIPRNAATQP